VSHLNPRWCKCQIEHYLRRNGLQGTKQTSLLKEDSVGITKVPLFSSNTVQYCLPLFLYGLSRCYLRLKRKRNNNRYYLAPANSNLVHFPCKECCTADSLFFYRPAAKIPVFGERTLLPVYIFEPYTLTEIFDFIFFHVLSAV
jgi:hypothetical protein